jgi:hypothetical protein
MMVTRKEASGKYLLMTLMCEVSVSVASVGLEALSQQWMPRSIPSMTMNLQPTFGTAAAIQQAARVPKEWKLCGALPWKTYEFS